MLEFLQAITGIFVVVYDGQHALKFTLGRARRVVGPGLHFKWPIIQRFQVKDTRHTTLDLEPQTIQLADDLVYEVDTKVLYQVVDVRKAIIEIDDLVVGLRNRVVLAVQRVVGAQDRRSIKDTEGLEEAIHAQLATVEEAWGVNILAVGFSNLSPSPATLEITQLELLARERLSLYGELRENGLSAEASVALVTGAIVTTTPEEEPPVRRRDRLPGERLQTLRQEEGGSIEAEEEPDGDGTGGEGGEGQGRREG